MCAESRLCQSVHQLTAAIASGDAQAFAGFYTRWFDFALAQARLASNRDEQFCLDVVQESMMKVIRSIKPIDSEIHLQNWLRTVVQSCCYDLLRRERRRRRRELTTASTSPPRSIDNHQLDERMQWLREQLASLDPEQARLLSMRFRMGWTLQRIGKALGLKPGAVDGRIARSIAILRAQAPEEFHD